MISPKARDLIKKSKDSFYYRRRIQLSNIPKDMSPEQVAEKYLKDFVIESIHRNDHGFVHILLKDPEEARKAVEAVAEMRSQDSSCKVDASVSQMDSLLFVGNLPLEYSEEDFRKMLEGYGSIVRSWLVRSPRDGSSKGYGFVEFVHRDDCGKAKAAIPSQQITPGRTIRVDFSSSNLREFDDCHSCSLFVDKLPPDATNEMLYDLFNEHRPISFLQIAIHPQTGRARNFSMVDCLSPDDAEYFWKVLDKTKLGSSEIRVYFSNPGRSATTVMTGAGGNRKNSSGGDRRSFRNLNPQSGNHDSCSYPRHGAYSGHEIHGRPPAHYVDLHAAYDSSMGMMDEFGRFPFPANYHMESEFLPSPSDFYLHGPYGEPEIMVPHGMIFDDNLPQLLPPEHESFQEYPQNASFPVAYPMHHPRVHDAFSENEFKSHFELQALASLPHFPGDFTAKVDKVVVIDHSKNRLPATSHHKLPIIDQNGMIQTHQYADAVENNINRPMLHELHSLEGSDINTAGGNIAVNTSKISDSLHTLSGQKQQSIVNSNGGSLYADSSQSLSRCVSSHQTNSQFDPSTVYAFPMAPSSSNTYPIGPQLVAINPSGSSMLPATGLPAGSNSAMSFQQFASQTGHHDIVHQYASQAASMAAWSVAIQMYNQQQISVNNNAALASTAAAAAYQQHQMFGYGQSQQLAPGCMATQNIPGQQQTTVIIPKITKADSGNGANTLNTSRDTITASAISYSSCPVSYITCKTTQDSSSGTLVSSVMGEKNSVSMLPSNYQSKASYLPPGSAVLASRFVPMNSQAGLPLAPTQNGTISTNR